MVLKTASPEEKAMAAARQKEWRAKNPERWKAIIVPARKKWKAANLDLNREIRRANRYKTRREILDLLGGQRCVHCGYDKDWRALQIDHINSDGRTDVRSDGLTNMWAFRTKLKNPEWNAEARKRYQVLCANCNHIKVYEKKEFPGSMPHVPPELNVRRRRKAKPRGYIET